MTLTRGRVLAAVCGALLMSAPASANDRKAEEAIRYAAIRLIAAEPDDVAEAIGVLRRLGITSVMRVPFTDKLLIQGRSEDVLTAIKFFLPL